ncbi:MAG TPA: siderophore-interacting protein [Roseateles sp.]|uniref:siderophore-interacting protein n=1 Tax=Roseateles sp. TaxID=1971397 RepID=UPI002ED9D161
MSIDTDAEPRRRIQRVRYELQRRELRVVRVEPRGGRFVAVTVQGDSLRTFESASFDDHVKLMLPDGAGGLQMRDYTPRAFDTERGELVLEFALHGEGPFTEWAAQARAGQALTVAGPRGSMVIPTDYDWHLLVGDDSAWPAIARRLEELPADARVQVLLLMPDAPAWPTRASAVPRFVASPEALAQALRDLALPPGDGFVWCAGEAQLMARLRDILLHEKGHPKEAMKVAAYWKRGATGYHARLDDDAPAR